MPAAACVYMLLSRSVGSKRVNVTDVLQFIYLRAAFIMPLEWSNENILKFLELFSNEPIIWDPSHKEHKLKHKVHDAWKRISVNFENANIDELKLKKKSLMTTFRSLLKKKKSSIRSGAGADEIFQPIWFAYDIMENFLGSIYDVQDTLNTEDEPKSDEKSVTSPTQVQYNEETLASSHNDDIPKTNVIKAPSIMGISLKKRKLNSSQNIEIKETQNKISQSFETLNQVLKNSIVNHTGKETSNEDDCDIYAKLLARKLRRYPETVRERIMHTIDGFLLENPVKRPSSDCSTYSVQSPIHHYQNSTASPSYTSVAKRPSSAYSTYSEQSPIYHYENSMPSPAYTSVAAGSFIPHPTTSAQMFIPEVNKTPQSNVNILSQRIVVPTNSMSSTAYTSDAADSCIPHPTTSVQMSIPEVNETNSNIIVSAFQKAYMDSQNLDI